MKLKVFTADSMAAGLAMVKKAMGPGAVILHTRNYKRGGILGFGARTVVEITVADQGAGAAGSSNARAGARSARNLPQASTNPARSNRANTAPASSSALSPSASAGDLIRRTYAVAKAELSKAQQQAPASPSHPVKTVSASPAAVAKVRTALPQPHRSDPAVITPTVAVVVPPPSDQLTQEMQAVKRMVARLVRQQRQRISTESSDAGGSQSGGGDLPDKLFDQYLTLLKQEVTEELAEEIVQQVRSALQPGDMENSAAVRRALLEAISKLIPADDSAGKIDPPADRRPRTIALVGPTGVGKTTTIAKLAANFKLKHRKSVGLITLDTYRIAAVDQLRTYAHIIGIPLHVAANADELAAALRRCATCDVVLIDTAGRSQRDDPRLEQLADFIKVANPHEVHLVLSSTCTQSVLLDTVERFSRIRTDRIIFTKLDEAVSFGVLLNVIRKVNKRLSFVTTGQEVPHHIEPGSSRRLAALVLGEGA